MLSTERTSMRLTRRSAQRRPVSLTARSRLVSCSLLSSLYFRPVEWAGACPAVRFRRGRWQQLPPVQESSHSESDLSSSPSTSRDDGAFPKEHSPLRGHSRDCLIPQDRIQNRRAPPVALF